MSSTYTCARARQPFLAPSDQPWARAFRLWRDQAKTQAAVVTAAAGTLQWPGGSSKVELDATVSGNVVTPGLSTDALSDMRAGTWWGELQFELDGTTAGQLRFDLVVQAGIGADLGAELSLGSTSDLVILAGALDVVMLDAGPPGPPGVGATLQRRAAGAVSGQRVVKDAGAGTCTYADPSDAGDAELVLGVTVAAASDGIPVIIQCLGDMVDSSWAWTPGQPLYVGPLGQLVQTPPTSGWLMRVGVAISPTQIVIGLQPAIQLL